MCRATIFAAADADLRKLVADGDRGMAVAAAAHGATEWIRAAHARGEIAGVVAIGGSAGTTIGTAAMRALPIGLPKLMVSTLASGQVRHYVGDKDILMLNTVVDLAGLNRVTCRVLSAAARAMAGMVQLEDRGAPPRARPLVAATMFGVTTPCVEAAKARSNEPAMRFSSFMPPAAVGRRWNRSSTKAFIAGVLDITTTELADELVGGVLSAGPDRLTAAATRCAAGGFGRRNRHGQLSFAGQRARAISRAEALSSQSQRHADAHDGRRMPRIGTEIGRKLAASPARSRWCCR